MSATASLIQVSLFVPDHETFTPLSFVVAQGKSGLCRSFDECVKETPSIGITRCLSITTFVEDGSQTDNTSWSLALEP